MTEVCCFGLSTFVCLQMHSFLKELLQKHALLMGILAFFFRLALQYLKFEPKLFPSIQIIKATPLSCCPLPHIFLLNLILVVLRSSPALRSLVTAYFQRSQAWNSGTAPRSGLGDGGVSQETEHKYRDPNNLIISGAIRSRILEAYPGVCVWRRAVDGQLRTGLLLKVFGESQHLWILLICNRSC